MKLRRIVSCFLLGFVFVFSANAQDEGKAILLKTILETLSKQHKVTFNYIEEEIAIFKIAPPKSSLPINEKLDYISAKTKLEFKFISSNYISVINNKKLDKPLCGFLKDSATNESIAFATIRISNTDYSTTSNEKGYFEIQLKSPNDIEITHVNFEKIILKPEQLYKENCPEIVLKTSVNDLAEVATEVYLTKGISKKLDGTYEIKPKKFGLLPGLTEADVLETLKQIPGIASTDETITNINVRGGTHDQNLFLWNGVRLFQTGHFFGLISALNPNLAHTIKITKNGSSAFYGESVSSVIDISTHTNSIENFNSSFGVNMINADIYAKFKPSKTSNLEISGRRSYTDLINSPTYKNYYNRVFQNTAVTNLTNNELLNYSNDENFYFYDFTVQLRQKFGSKTELSLDAINITNLLDLNESKIENNTKVSKYSCLEQQTLGGNIALKTVWNKKNQTEINGYASYYSTTSENESIESNQVSSQENTILDTGLRLKNSHKLSEKITFNNGYQYNEIGIQNFDQINSPLFSRKIKDVLRIHALIAEIQYSSENNTLKTSLGIRQNYIEELKEYIFEPRLQLNYSFCKQFQLELLAEKKSQSTSQIIDLQQDFLGIEKRRWILANNEDIPIVKNNQVSLGFTYKKNNWLITLDNFYKSVTGITSRSQGFQNQLEFEKINGNYIVYGSEFLIQKQLKNLTAWLSYTYTDNKYKFDNYEINSFSNNYEINHNIGMAVIYDYKNLKVALGSRWFTGKPTTLPTNSSSFLTTQKIEYQLPNASNIKNYFQLNFSSSYVIKMKEKTKLLVGFSITNLLNNDNLTNTYFRINKNTSSIEQVNNSSLELTPNAFIRYFL